MAVDAGASAQQALRFSFRWAFLEEDVIDKEGGVAILRGVLRLTPPDGLNEHVFGPAELADLDAVGVRDAEMKLLFGYPNMVW